MTRFESNADDGEFFLPSRLFVTGFKVSLVECFLGCSFVPLCIAKIAGMVSFPGYKALFHRHKCFNRNGGVPSISFVGFVEKFRETCPIYRILSNNRYRRNNFNFTRRLYWKRTIRTYFTSIITITIIFPIKSNNFSISSNVQRQIRFSIFLSS